MTGLFISHAHDDKLITHALAHLFNAPFSKNFEIWYSSDIRPGGGTANDWRSQIREQIEACKFMLVVLTPLSYQRSWILWEVSAAYAMQHCDDCNQTIHIYPVSYDVNFETLPKPLSLLTIKDGTKGDDIKKIYSDIAYILDYSIDEERLDYEVQSYLKSIEEHRKTNPRYITFPARRYSDLQVQNIIGCWQVRWYIGDKKNGNSIHAHEGDWVELINRRDRILGIGYSTRTDTLSHDNPTYPFEGHLSSRGILTLTYGDVMGMAFAGSLTVKLDYIGTTMNGTWSGFSGLPGEEMRLITGDVVWSKVEAGMCEERKAAIYENRISSD